MSLYSTVSARTVTAARYASEGMRDLAAGEVLSARMTLRACDARHVASEIAERWGALGAGYRKPERVYPMGAMCPVMVGARHVTEVMHEG